MTEMTGSPVSLDSSEDFTVHAFHLGSSIPTGVQSVSVTAGSANSKTGVAISVTAAADTEE